jgi:hypothetical protein
MLKNARKVDKEVGKPIVDSLKDKGHIPGPYLSQIEESVMAKVEAFNRKLDGPFTREFGRSFHEMRQKAWKRAADKERKNPFGSIYPQLSGGNFAAPEEAILRDPMRSQTYIAQGGLNIKLPRAVMCWYDYNTYESSAIQSGLIPGRTSTSIEMLQYEVTASVPDARQYINELDELKYIYKGFWFLSRINKKNWIRILYSDPNSKIIDYNLSKVSCPDGLRRSDDTVLLVVEGTDIYTTVDELYDWITFYRSPRKKYAIGECDSEMCVHYAIYLGYMYGIPKEVIQERLTVDLVEDVKSHMEVLHLGLTPRVEETNEDAEALRALGVDVSLMDFPTIEDKAVEAHEAIYRTVPVNFKDGIIDLSQLDDCETDSFVSSEDLSERQSEVWEEELPYDPEIHKSNNEFESFYLSHKRDAELVEDNESVNSDNVPDQELDPVEELGIDLIDPSRDTVDQPTLRRIGLIWNPGGGSRSIVRRFQRSLVTKGDDHG